MQPCATDRERQRVKHLERREKVKATHKIIIIDRRDMPCRVECLPGAGNRRVSEGVHCR